MADDKSSPAARRQQNAAFTPKSDVRTITIFDAAGAGDVDLVKCYISGTHGLPVTDINIVDENGMSPLHHAAKRGHLTVVSFLVRSGASLDISDKSGRLPWQVSATDDVRLFMVGPSSLPMPPLNLRVISTTRNSICIAFDMQPSHPAPQYFVCKYMQEEKGRALVQADAVDAAADAAAVAAAAAGRVLLAESVATTMNLFNVDAVHTYCITVFAGASRGLEVSGSNQLTGVRPTADASINVYKPSEGTMHRVANNLRVEWCCTGTVDRVDIVLWIRGNCLGAVAVRTANYGSFDFRLPLELPSSSYYQVEVRCSDSADAVGMSPVFSIAQDSHLITGWLADSTHASKMEVLE